jgi:hypothetical protein
VTFHIDGLKLVEGTYRLDLAAHKLDGYPYDYHRLLYSFRMKSRTKDVGIYRPDHRWSFSPNIGFTTGRVAGRAPVESAGQSAGTQGDGDADLSS